MRTILAAALLAGACAAQTYSLESAAGLTARKVAVEAAIYQGRKAIRVTDALPAQPNDGGEDRLAILDGSNFSDGVIELELAGRPGARASEAARGFVGVAFRVAPDVSRFECFYLRPTNGRAEDQVRRNHSLQYISFPEFPWQRLRKEFPEMYESYADLVPGEWTRVKIEVRGGKARLLVHGAPQPSLIVNDLKSPVKSGSVALWIGPGTEAHFTALRIIP